MTDKQFAGLPYDQQPFAGQQVAMDPLALVGWNMRQPEIDALCAVLEKWRPIIDRASEWYLRQGDERRAGAFAAMLADFDEVLARHKGP